MNNFDFELLSEQRFSNIGIDSESSIFNLYSFLVIHCLIIMLHISIHFLRYLMSKIDMHLDCLCCIKLLKLLVNKTFNLLTFGFYIRSVMEMVQFITICSILEVYIWKTESDLRIVSLGFALLILCAFICFILANAYFACSSYKLEENKHNKFGEFIQNLKPQMKSRLLNVILSIRRLCFAIALVCMSETTSKLLIGVMTLIQVCYFAYIVISRPYLDIKSNLILISNELFFSILLSALIFLNGEEDWSSMKNTSYFSLLISNNLLTFLIVLIDGIKIIVNKCKKCMSKELQRTTAVVTKSRQDRILEEQKEDERNEKENNILESYLRFYPNNESKMRHD